MTSRAELIAWVNDLLQINYTKIEQCGSGAAYAQIIDSIYQDVPLSKIKMNANQEYEYLNNFKVLQNIFKKHQIDKPIPVTALVKCKMQDNLEFMQWLKKYWDMHYPGGDYDAVARRRGAPAEPNPLIASGPSAKSSANGGSGLRATSTRTSKTPSASTNARVGVRAVGGTQREVEQLTNQLEEFKLSVEGLEKERDFYFNKLRDIEILIGVRVEVKDGSVSEAELENLKQIQAILYSTEEGFEVPEPEAGLVDEEETF
ncbi:calponin homology domain-containing protein [Phakopsora pachyrhizi]|uniref:Calponin homology domain-containing protein n=1 Tax=Phakopsora pachyrhizi TaxID=170000 RepID=A0AAV0AJJ5_PHAPC|nr:calponin homology domain-containing protein [Phakopsora pachyrhizi]CAH7667718.1 calponin homology domain-containing protein [Phakopsora pachyrhizi]